MTMSVHIPMHVYHYPCMKCEQLRGKIYKEYNITASLVVFTRTCTIIDVHIAGRVSW